MWGKCEKSELHLLQSQQVLDYLFGVTNGEREKKYRLQKVLGYLFPVFYGQRSMTNEGGGGVRGGGGGKKKRPAPTASTAGTWLSVVNIGILT